MGGEAGKWGGGVTKGKGWVDARGGSGRALPWQQTDWQ